MTDQTRQEFDGATEEVDKMVRDFSKIGKHAKSEIRGRILRYGDRTYAAGRSAGLEEAAQIADYHHENHCTNNDHQYRNCGMAIATGIRDLLKAAAILKRKEGK